MTCPHLCAVNEQHRIDLVSTPLFKSPRHESSLVEGAFAHSGQLAAALSVLTSSKFAQQKEPQHCNNVAEPCLAGCQELHGGAGTAIGELLPLAVPAMEWANSAALSSVTAAEMHVCAVQLFRQSCIKGLQPLAAQGRQQTLRGRPTALREQLLHLALQGMALRLTDKAAAPENDACPSQHTAAGDRLAAGLSSSESLQLDSHEIWVLATCGVAWSMQTAIALAPDTAKEIPQVRGIFRDTHLTTTIS